MNMQKEAEQLWKALIFHNGHPHQRRRESEIDYMKRILDRRIDLILQSFEKVCREQREPELKNGTYYLVLTIKNKWGIALWENKWWSDEDQIGSLKFGIKDEWIKTYYALPSY